MQIRWKRLDKMSLDSIRELEKYLNILPQEHLEVLKEVKHKKLVSGNYNKIFNKLIFTGTSCFVHELAHAVRFKKVKERALDFVNISWKYPSYNYLLRVVLLTLGINFLFWVQAGILLWMSSSNMISLNEISAVIAAGIFIIFSIVVVMNTPIRKYIMSILQKKDSDYVSAYAKWEAEDDFADTYEVYVLNGDKFREALMESDILLKKYIWMKNNVFKGIEYARNHDTGALQILKQSDTGSSTETASNESTEDELQLNFTPGKWRQDITKYEYEVLPKLEVKLNDETREARYIGHGLYGNVFEHPFDNELVIKYIDRYKYPVVKEFERMKMLHDIKRGPEPITVKAYKEFSYIIASKVDGATLTDEFKTNGVLTPYKMELVRQLFRDLIGNKIKVKDIYVMKNIMIGKIGDNDEKAYVVDAGEIHRSRMPKWMLRGYYRVQLRDWERIIPDISEDIIEKLIGEEPLINKVQEPVEKIVIDSAPMDIEEVHLDFRNLTVSGSGSARLDHLLKSLGRAIKVSRISESNILRSFGKTDVSDLDGEGLIDHLASGKIEEFIKHLNKFGIDDVSKEEVFTVLLHLYLSQSGVGMIDDPLNKQKGRNIVMEDLNRTVNEQITGMDSGLGTDGEVVSYSETKLIRDPDNSVLFALVCDTNREKWLFYVNTVLLDALSSIKKSGDRNYQRFIDALAVRSIVMHELIARREKEMRELGGVNLSYDDSNIIFETFIHTDSSVVPANYADILTKIKDKDAQKKISDYPHILGYKAIQTLKNAGAVNNDNLLELEELKSTIASKTKGTIGFTYDELQELAEFVIKNDIGGWVLDLGLLTRIAKIEDEYTGLAYAALRALAYSGAITEEDAGDPKKLTIVIDMMVRSLRMRWDMSQEEIAAADEYLFKIVKKLAYSEKFRQMVLDEITGKTLDVAPKKIASSITILGRAIKIIPGLWEELVSMMKKEDGIVDIMAHPVNFSNFYYNDHNKNVRIANLFRSKTAIERNIPDELISLPESTHGIDEVFKKLGGYQKQGRSIVSKKTDKAGLMTRIKFMKKEEEYYNFYFEPYVFDWLSKENEKQGKDQSYTGIIPSPVKNPGTYSTLSGLAGLTSSISTMNRSNKHPGTYVALIAEADAAKVFTLKERKELISDGKGNIFAFIDKAKPGYYDYKKEDLTVEDAIETARNLLVLHKNFGILHQELLPMFHGVVGGEEGFGLEVSVVGRNLLKEYDLDFVNLRGGRAVADMSRNHLYMQYKKMFWNFIGNITVDMAISNLMFQIILWSADRISRNNSIIDKKKALSKVIRSVIQMYYREYTGVDLEEYLNYDYYSSLLMDKMGLVEEAGREKGVEIIISPQATHNLACLTAYVSIEILEHLKMGEAPEVKASLSKKPLVELYGSLGDAEWLGDINKELISRNNEKPLHILNIDSYIDDAKSTFNKLEDIRRLKGNPFVYITWKNHDKSKGTTTIEIIAGRKNSILVPPNSINVGKHDKRKIYSGETGVVMTRKITINREKKRVDLDMGAIRKDFLEKGYLDNTYHAFMNSLRKIIGNEYPDYDIYAVFDNIFTLYQFKEHFSDVKPTYYSELDNWEVDEAGFFKKRPKDMIREFKAKLPSPTVESDESAISEEASIEPEPLIRSIDDVEIKTPIAATQMSKVFMGKVKEKDIDEDVIVKESIGDFEPNLIKEAEILEKISNSKSDNKKLFPKYYGMFRDKATGKNKLVMEYIKGPRLDEVMVHIAGLKDDLRNKDKMLEIITRISVHILKGLELVNEAGYVVNDLRPANILLEETKGDDYIFELGGKRYSSIRLIDFGTSTPVEKEGDPLPDEDWLGVPGFASPEMFKHHKYPGPKGDLYNLGVILGLILTSKMINDLYKPENDTIISLVRAISGEFASIVKNSTQEDPELRASADELLEKLLSYSARHNIDLSDIVPEYDSYSYKFTQEESDYIDEISKKEGIRKSGDLMYKVLEEGRGARPNIDDKILVHFRGILPDGREFDSSYRAGSPIMFKVSWVGAWHKLLENMRVGGKYRFYLPSKIAYGKEGIVTPSGEVIIPPDTTVIFEIELLDMPKVDLFSDHLNIFPREFEQKYDDFIDVNPGDKVLILAQAQSDILKEAMSIHDLLVSYVQAKPTILIMYPNIDKDYEDVLKGNYDKIINLLDTEKPVSRWFDISPVDLSEQNSPSGYWPVPENYKKIGGRRVVSIESKNWSDLYSVLIEHGQTKDMIAIQPPLGINDLIAAIKKAHSAASVITKTEYTSEDYEEIYDLSPGERNKIRFPGFGELNTEQIILKLRAAQSMFKDHIDPGILVIREDGRIKEVIKKTSLFYEEDDTDSEKEKGKKKKKKGNFLKLIYDRDKAKKKKPEKKDKKVSITEIKPLPKKQAVASGTEKEFDDYVDEIAGIFEAKEAVWVEDYIKAKFKDKNDRIKVASAMASFVAGKDLDRIIHMIREGMKIDSGDDDKELVVLKKIVNPTGVFIPVFKEAMKKSSNAAVIAGYLRESANFIWYLNYTDRYFIDIQKTASVIPSIIKSSVIDEQHETVEDYKRRIQIVQVFTEYFHEEEISMDDTLEKIIPAAADVTRSAQQFEAYLTSIRDVVDELKKMMSSAVNTDETVKIKDKTMGSSELIPFFRTILPVIVKESTSYSEFMVYLGSLGNLYKKAIEYRIAFNRLNRFIQANIDKFKKKPALGKNKDKNKTTSQALMHFRNNINTAVKSIDSLVSVPLDQQDELLISEFMPYLIETPRYYPRFSEIINRFVKIMDTAKTNKILNEMIDEKYMLNEALHYILDADEVDSAMDDIEEVMKEYIRDEEVKTPSWKLNELMNNIDDEQYEILTDEFIPLISKDSRYSKRYPEIMQRLTVVLEDIVENDLLGEILDGYLFFNEIMSFIMESEENVNDALTAVEDAVSGYVPGVSYLRDFTPADYKEIFTMNDNGLEKITYKGFERFNMKQVIVKLRAAESLFKKGIDFGVRIRRKGGKIVEVVQFRKKLYQEETSIEPEEKPEYKYPKGITLEFIESIFPSGLSREHIRYLIGSSSRLTLGKQKRFLQYIAQIKYISKRQMTELFKFMEKIEFKDSEGILPPPFNRSESATFSLELEFYIKQFIKSKMSWEEMQDYFKEEGLKKLPDTMRKDWEDDSNWLLLYEDGKYREKLLEYFQKNIDGLLSKHAKQWKREKESDDAHEFQTMGILSGHGDNYHFNASSEWKSLKNGIRAFQDDEGLKFISLHMHLGNEYMTRVYPKKLELEIDKTGFAYLAKAYESMWTVLSGFGYDPSQKDHAVFQGFVADSHFLRYPLNISEMSFTLAKLINLSIKYPTIEFKILNALLDKNGRINTEKLIADLWWAFSLMSALMKRENKIYLAELGIPVVAKDKPTLKQIKHFLEYVYEDDIVGKAIALKKFHEFKDQESDLSTKLLVGRRKNIQKIYDELGLGVVYKRHLEKDGIDENINEFLTGDSRKSRDALSRLAKDLYEVKKEMGNMFDVSRFFPESTRVVIEKAIDAYEGSLIEKNKDVADKIILDKVVFSQEQRPSGIASMITAKYKKNTIGYIELADLEDFFIEQDDAPYSRDVNYGLNNTLLISNLRVNNHYRHQGIAESLRSKAIDFALANGYRYITAYLKPGASQKIMKKYPLMRYEKDAEIKGYVRLDLHKMITKQSIIDRIRAKEPQSPLIKDIIKEDRYLAFRLLSGHNDSAITGIPYPVKRRTMSKRMYDVELDTYRSFKFLQQEASEQIGGLQVKISEQELEYILPTLNVFGLMAYKEDKDSGKPVLIMHRELFNAVFYRGPPEGMKWEEYVRNIVSMAKNVHDFMNANPHKTLQDYFDISMPGYAEFINIKHAANSIVRNNLSDMTNITPSFNIPTNNERIRALMLLDAKKIDWQIVEELLSSSDVAVLFAVLYVIKNSKEKVPGRLMDQVLLKLKIGYEELDKEIVRTLPVFGKRIEDILKDRAVRVKDAGTGKTEILSLRAHYLIKPLAEARIKLETNGLSFNEKKKKLREIASNSKNKVVKQEARLRLIPIQWIASQDELDKLNKSRSPIPSAKTVIDMMKNRETDKDRISSKTAAKLAQFIQEEAKEGKRDEYLKYYESWLATPFPEEVLRRFAAVEDISK
ncbi:FKBP-type peptidyl-prolyl cis-trans isomerase, partial [Elusimicrobiota bacterium]